MTNEGGGGDKHGVRGQKREALCRGSWAVEAASPPLPPGSSGKHLHQTLVRCSVSNMWKCENQRDPDEKVHEMMRMY